MVIVVVRFSNLFWEDGEIYDPYSGKTYSCTMKISEGKLNIRGYIGISLLGRTAVWERAK